MEHMWTLTHEAREAKNMNIELQIKENERISHQVWELNR